MEDRVLSEIIARKGLTGYRILHNGGHVVKLTADSPVPLSVYARETGDLLFGDPEAEKPVITVYSSSHGRELVSGEMGTEVAYAVQQDKERLTYRASMSKDGAMAVEFDLTFALSDNDLLVSFGKVKEHPGYQLINVRLNRMISAHSIQENSRLAIGSHAGRLIDPAKVGPGEHYHKYKWTKEAFSTIGIVYNTDLTAVLELNSLDDTLLSSVQSNASGKFAGIGVELRYRYPSSIPSAQFAPHETTSFRIHLIDSNVGSPERGWVIGARYLREQHGSPLPELYQDTFINKIWIGWPGAPAEHTFDQALELIKKIYNVTDGVRQVDYLVGFQHMGHDTGYPDVFTVNEQAGGMPGLLNLFEESEKLNTVLSLHDNYDDAYLSSPSWDPKDISTDLEGGLLKGGVWNGEQAYWISLPYYIKTKAAERIKQTKSMYPVEETYHLDVLTASVFRVDYRPEEPTGKDADWKARMDLVALFRENGLDLTSEGCGLPFIDHIRYFWNLPRPKEQVFEGDRRIPLAPFIAHGKVNYGGSLATPDWIIDGLLYGAFYSQDLRPETSLKEIMNSFYLLYVPLNMLRAADMVNYQEDGTRKRVTYSDGSFVEVDFESLSNEVYVRGVRVIKDFACFAPGTREGTYLFYRGEWTTPAAWKLPDQWKGSKSLTLTALTPLGDGDCTEIECEDETITFHVPAGVPFRVTN